MVEGFGGVVGYLGCGPLTVTVTTRIITFLVGDSYKPSFPTITGKGDNPKYNIPRKLVKDCGRYVLRHTFLFN